MVVIRISGNGDVEISVESDDRQSTPRPTEPMINTESGYGGIFPLSDMVFVPEGVTGEWIHRSELEE